MLVRRTPPCVEGLNTGLGAPGCRLHGFRLAVLRETGSVAAALCLRSLTASRSSSLIEAFRHDEQGGVGSSRVGTMSRFVWPRGRRGGSQPRFLLGYQTPLVAVSSDRREPRHRAQSLATGSWKQLGSLIPERILSVRVGPHKHPFTSWLIANPEGSECDETRVCGRCCTPR